MITAPSNPRLRLLRRLQERRARARLGLFAVEGEDLVEAGLDAGLEPVEALVDAERPVLLERLPAAEPVAPALLAEASALGHPPRVVAVFRRDALPALPEPPPPLGLALWRVADPGNVGTLLRSADAWGGFAALSPGCADLTAPKALRASAGAVFRVPTCRFDDAPGTRVALVLDGAPLPEVELPEATTFVLGAERAGVPEDVAAACALRVAIPQTGGAESLNVAAAGTVALWEWARRRRA